MKYPIEAAMVVVSILLASCGTTPVADEASKPPEPFTNVEARNINTKDMFLAEVAGRKLSLVADDLKANLTFNDDDSASGQLIRDNGEIQDVNLVWEWEGDVYCRTGTVGLSETERKCERVTLYPGVGVQLSYTDSDDPDEFWTFD